MSIRTIGDERVVSEFKALGPKARDAAATSVGRLALMLQARITTQKLTGQVLRVRTGTLRRSVDNDVQVSDTEILGIVFTNLEYAAKHEYGFTGTESVKSHMRTMRMAWGRPMKEPKEVTVRAHTRNIDYPARSYMRTALQEMKPQIESDIEASVLKEI
jgi:phage gpG-like protein